MSRTLFDHYGPMFMNHVKKTDSCWLWTGAKGPRNVDFTPVEYGVYMMRKPKRHRLYAHRFSYELHLGPIPKGLQVDHLCRNTLCVNPAHLEPVTAKTNLLRGNTMPAIHAKKTHCPRGHAYAGDNLVARKRRGTVMRECRACKNALQNASRARRISASAG